MRDRIIIGAMCMSLVLLSLNIYGNIKQQTIATTAQAQANYAGKVALTYDDGPHVKYSEQILDLLEEKGVKATFFIMGQSAEEYPEIVKRMTDEGHIVGNHTYSHLQLTSGNHEKFQNELVKTNEILYNITGEEVAFIRPPYGSWDKKFEKELSLIPVLWSIDTLDWCSTDVGCIVEKVMTKVKDGSIILMHDSYPTTVTAT